MTDGQALKRAIADAPSDDAPRLVYADWLDEGNGADGEAPEFRRMVADPAWRAVVATEPALGRGLDVMSDNGVPLVGIVRGCVEYVRLTRGGFLGALEVLFGLPVLVVDIMGISPGSQTMDGREYRCWRPTTAAPQAWYRERPDRLPVAVCDRLSAAVRRPGGWFYSGSRAQGATYDVSRAAVRWLRESSGLRPVTDEEFRKAENRWAGSSLQAVSTGLVWDPEQKPPGILVYDAAFAPPPSTGTDAYFRAFQGSRMARVNEQPFVSAVIPCPLNVPGAQWSNVRFEIGGKDGKAIANKVADNRRGVVIDPTAYDRFFRAAYLAGQEAAYEREKRVLDQFFLNLNTEDFGVAQEETPGA